MPIDYAVFVPLMSRVSAEEIVLSSKFAMETAGTGGVYDVALAGRGGGGGGGGGEGRRGEMDEHRILKARR